MILEVQLGANLIPARIADDASRIAKIHVGRVAHIEASEVVVVRRVENVKCEANGSPRSPEARKIFPKAHIKVLIRERAWRSKTTAQERVRGVRGRTTETTASRINICFSAQRQQ